MDLKLFCFREYGPLFSLHFVNLFYLYLNMFLAGLKVPFDIMGHIYRYVMTSCPFSKWVKVYTAKFFM